ncbi:MAG TPA: NAD-dependent epimerase/dehydratase family protein [Ktedonobacterales bacterium]|jgi:2'-hydroxyisoflavone reductase|nr:NAD-dependent epimerase/dehydratase family protein [Ktedonobacterales bacterium]
MRVLILGGTKFLGRHLVDAAMARGHAVTTFTRGAHDDVLPPAVERLTGDRDGDMSALTGQTWDAVLDTSGYVPRVVGASARLLAEQVDFYVFVSSISVYKDWPGVSAIDESHAVGALEDPSVEEVNGETYGPLKALCEREVEAVFENRCAIVRPGLIVGPYDPTNRFTYWPDRVARGGEVLAPGRPESLTQIIDARNLADWIVTLAERKTTGVYNATGPNYPLSMQRALEVMREVSESDARFTWVSDEFLERNEVGAWMEMPLWIPEKEGPGVGDVNFGRALAAGLTFRPLEETVRDTLAWRKTTPADAEWPAGLKSDRESELLALWHSEQSS